MIERKYNKKLYPHCFDEDEIRALEALHDANKNCLNCHNYYFNAGNQLNCKLGKKFHTICKEWMQK